MNIIQDIAHIFALNDLHIVKHEGKYHSINWETYTTECGIPLGLDKFRYVDRVPSGDIFCAECKSKTEEL